MIIPEQSHFRSLRAENLTLVQRMGQGHFNTPRMETRTRQGDVSEDNLDRHGLAEVQNVQEK